MGTLSGTLLKANGEDAKTVPAITARE
jgi:hypothetical protein